MRSALIKILYHEDFMLHRPDPYPHPENPGRLREARAGLSMLTNYVSWIEPEEGPIEAYLEAHTQEYLNRILTLANSGEVEFLDPDTYVSPGTPRAIRRLSGAVTSALDIVGRGEGPVLILGRPPGHHAGRGGPALGAPTLGFCIVNTSALLALRLWKHHGSTAVVDFDAHHGNGTQEILWDTPIFHFDIHQDARTIYPGTGLERRTGYQGTKVNYNLRPGAGDREYEAVIREIGLELEEIDPDYIVVSAGFDAYRDDTPFVSLNATEKTFRLIGSMLSKWSGRTVIMLEGGYSTGLRHGLPSFIAGLLGVFS
ncbi:MAG: histone deacetylase family protein [Desulfurococcales archaeon]|nr:histone deacetylase family protein [Desulfurococcales archaeon]